MCGWLLRFPVRSAIIAEAGSECLHEKKNEKYKFAYAVYCNDFCRKLFVENIPLNLFKVLLTFLQVPPSRHKGLFLSSKTRLPKLPGSLFSVCFERLFKLKKGAFNSSLKTLYWDANMIKKRTLGSLWDGFCTIFHM